MNNRYIWFAFGIGAALGGAVALLFAPQTGAKTRKELELALDDVADRASDYADDASDYLKEQAARLTAEAQRTVKVASEKATDLANAAVKQGTAQVSAVKSMF